MQQTSRNVVLLIALAALTGFLYWVAQSTHPDPPELFAWLLVASVPLWAEALLLFITNKENRATLAGTGLLIAGILTVVSTWPLTRLTLCLHGCGFEGLIPLALGYGLGGLMVVTGAGLTAIGLLMKSRSQAIEPPGDVAHCRLLHCL